MGYIPGQMETYQLAEASCRDVSCGRKTDRDHGLCPQSDVDVDVVYHFVSWQENRQGSMGYNPSHVAACLLLTLVAAEVQKKPNIIMFIGDDVGTADHQLYDRFMHTPNLLELAKLGITMNQSYTLQACTPTRTALLTGKLVALVA